MRFCQQDDVQSRNFPSYYLVVAFFPHLTLVTLFQPAWIVTGCGGRVSDILTRILNKFLKQFGLNKFNLRVNLLAHIVSMPRFFLFVKWRVRFFFPGCPRTSVASVV